MKIVVCCLVAIFGYSHSSLLNHHAIKFMNIHSFNFQGLSRDKPTDICLCYSHLSILILQMYLIAVLILWSFVPEQRSGTIDNHEAVEIKQLATSGIDFIGKGIDVCRHIYLQSDCKVLCCGSYNQATRPFKKKIVQKKNLLIY